MRLSLRERRRLETAKDIQRVTLKLAIENGFENVTTEAIAEAAQISTRTFFNYYSNKEAAAVGHPPKFSDEDCAALREGQNPLAQDLRHFLGQHLAHLTDDEDIIRAIGLLLQENSKMRFMLDQHLAQLTSDLAEALQPRMPNRDLQLAQALAEWAIHIIGRAIHFWIEAPDQPLSTAMDQVWSNHLALAQLLLDRP
ncbi:MAG: TetR/AcrR family transcriptional regulator [Mangrovicoccus sp.]